MLNDLGIDTLILQAAGFDPARAKAIEETCTFSELARALAVRAAVNAIKND